jgi:hypothetical protein
MKKKFRLRLVEGGIGEGACLCQTCAKCKHRVNKTQKELKSEIERQGVLFVLEQI